MVKKRHRLRVGDRVVFERSGHTGEVVKLLGPQRTAGNALAVRVLWDESGETGFMFESRLKKVKS